MPSQDDLFQEDVDFPIYDDLSYGGALKTQNPKADPYQRNIITSRGRRSKEFQATVRLMTCVHGTLTATDTPPVPASLIVLDFRLNSPHDCTYEQLYTSLIFSSCDRPYDGSEIPEVIAWAPFEDDLGWSSSGGVVVNVTENKSARLSQIGVTGPGGIGGNIGIDLGKSTERKFEVLDGKLLQVIPRQVNQESNGADTISWNMSEGRTVHTGIPSVLRTAVLVQRKSNAKFQAVFELELKAGMRYKLENKKNNFFCRGESDDPILFDPSRKPQGKIDGIVPDNLKALIVGDESLGPLGFFKNPILLA